MDTNEMQNQSEDKIGKYVKTGTSIFLGYNLIKNIVFSIFLVILGIFLVHISPDKITKIFINHIFGFSN